MPQHPTSTSKAQPQNLSINNWKQKFESCLNELSWISDVRLCGVKSGEFINLNNEETDVGKFENSKNIDLSSDSVFVLRNNNFINLWPLILFGTPQLSSTKENLNKFIIEEFRNILIQQIKCDIDNINKAEEAVSSNQIKHLEKQEFFKKESY